ncbi:aminotransferase class V-fold PLP-dependent enzyme [Blastococcus saxobsidens]|uniref:aminotransferase class V-fold PLP-dependent enzyme n=1 Tax=Blastococcus saxobsidens TaxID=138336 RepID=UPI001E2E3C4E|nr:aminotransferase class V-fold PLP-dependent enzyme [Blastococcus saxobsidens]
MANRVHLNNAGAALMPAVVVQTLIEHVEREAAIGGYEAHAEAADRVEGVYDSLARLVGGHRDEIAVADSATLAWQRLFYSLPLSAGDRILTTTAEFASNYVSYLQAMRTKGVTVETIPDDASGALDPAALESMIDERVKLISITWVPTNGGLRNPAAAVGRIARRHGIPYLLDACQAVGQMPIDVEALGCTMLTATGRKFLRAPRGTGFLYVAQDFLRDLEPAFIDLYGAPYSAPGGYQLRPDARRFETWETNYSTRLALGAAAEYAMSWGPEQIERRCTQLAEQLRTGLQQLSGVTVRDLGEHQSAIITFSHDAVPAQQVKEALARSGINASVTPPTSTPLDAAARNLPDLVRLSPHYYNTTEEIAVALRALEGTTA